MAPSAYTWPSTAAGRAGSGSASLFARHAGYNRWADSNRIVVLYPQAITRYGWGPWPWPTSFVFNPNGCWDWWGYTGVNYHTKAGAQIRAVKAMLDRLAAKPLITAEARKAQRTRGGHLTCC